MLIKNRVFDFGILLQNAVKKVIRENNEIEC